MEIDGQLWSLGEESAENDQQKDESFEEESVNRFLIYRILGCLVYSLLELPVKFCSEYPTKQICFKMIIIKQTYKHTAMVDLNSKVTNFVHQSKQLTPMGEL